MNDFSDIFIIGGGINGAAIASDAAGRGLNVTLCEQGDLASGTSSASTKLIHGGLRYLELYEFHLVKSALREREILLRKSPNLVSPLEFILPHEKHLRPAWMIRLGLFLYDHLSARKYLPRSHAVNFKTDPRGAALLPQFEKGFSYYDCFTDDARLTILNAISAKEYGAKILTHTQFLSAERENNLWKITLKNAAALQPTICYAKALVNAAGPWINQVQKNIVGQAEFSIKLVKGSHIIVPKLYDGDFAYILQNKDGRIVFTIPYQDKFTLIGTTDILYSSNPRDAKISAEEQNYLCAIINEYFKKKILPGDIVWSYAGVRCLQNEAEGNLSKISRDHKLVLDTNTSAPLLAVIGGKITTHRILAEEVLNQLKLFFPAMKSAWTASTPLPGGDCSLDKLRIQLKKEFSWLPDELINRYSKNYGTRAYLILKDVYSLQQLGTDFSAGLYQKEVDYLVNHEWAVSCDDVLWRRTKLGLFFTEQAKIKLTNYLLHFNKTT